MITEAQISTYLKDEIAVKNLLIAHTSNNVRYAGSIEESEVLVNSGKLQLQNFCLIADITTGTLTNNGGDSEEDTLSINLLVIKKLKSIDYTAELAITDGAKTIIGQILSKIYQAHHDNHTIWKWLDKSTKRYTKIQGTELDNVNGYSVELTLRMPFNLEYSASEWV